MKTFEAFDVVGDVHGQLEALLQLGCKLGYRVHEGWTHPEDRKLVFVGDLIDRGPNSLGVALLVRDIVLNGRGLCLMGNHEFNIIEWRRGRMGPKRSNLKIVDDIQNQQAGWDLALDFFESLPLALEFDDVRVVHAAWHHRAFLELEGALSAPSSNHLLAPKWSSFIRLFGPYEDGEFRRGVPNQPFEDQWSSALEVFLKGFESEADEPFKDGDGNTRTHVRAQWWRDHHNEVLKDRRIVFGHYWNIPPVEGHHSGFVPPHPSGHPHLRSWLNLVGPQVTSEGRVAVPPSQIAVCVDFSGVGGSGGAPCIGAYRYPEGEVVWASSAVMGA